MMQLFSRSLTPIFLGALLILNAGAIRKNEDPIARTQTDPISYKDKVEETKDGVKGAPAPSFSYYRKEKFLAKTAVDEEEDADKMAAPSESVAEVSEVDFEEEESEEALVSEESSEEEDEEWWVDEDESEENPEESLEPTDLQG